MKFCLRKLRSVVSLAVILFPISADAEDTQTYQLTDGQTVAPLERFQECDACPEMIVMPLGSFMMGAIEGESRNPFDIYGEGASGEIRLPGEINIMPNEHPRHLVEMDVPYAIGRNEVTHAEWMACVEGGGCSHNPEHEVLTSSGYVQLGPLHPAINVSYRDALEYVAWLNELVGADVYRLPTEAEWEYAARAGTETPFAQGQELTSNQANFSRTATEHVRQLESPEGMPHLVERRVPVPVNELDAANGWGVRHMSGNVQEHTRSCYTEQHLSLSRAEDYLAISRPFHECERTVVKGGAFVTAMTGLRLARRTRATDTYRRSFLGFRIARDLTLTGETS